MEISSTGLFSSSFLLALSAALAWVRQWRPQKEAREMVYAWDARVVANEKRIQHGLSLKTTRSFAQEYLTCTLHSSGLRV